MSVVHFAILSSIGLNGDGSRTPQAMLDFPHVEGPATPTGETLSVFYRIAGGDQCWAGTLQKCDIQIITEGIRTMASQMNSDTDDPLQCFVFIGEAEESLGPSIHTSAHSRILAAWGASLTDPVTNYASWLPGAVISAARWTNYRNALIVLGEASNAIDTWRSNHPDATPTDLWVALRNRIS